MTTPDTSAVRSWARDNGFDVADRGRLPAEVVDAYTAHKKGGTAKGGSAKAVSAKAVSAKAAPAKKASGMKPAAPAARTTAPATPARRPRTAPKPTPRAAATRAAAATAAPADDATSAFADASLEAITADPPAPHARAEADDRLAQLAEQVRALTDRVAALEGGSGKPGKSRFRRQR